METFGNNIEVPKHKGGLHISHNEHKNNYLSIREHINDLLRDDNIPYHIIRSCISADSIWQMDVFKDTLVIDYTKYSPTFEGLFTE